MIGDVVDNILGNIEADEATQPGVETKPEAQEGQEEGAQEEQSEQKTETDQKEADTPFPKKAINALSRRDKTIGKLKHVTEQQQAELNALKAEVEKFRSSNTPPKNQGPQEDDFQDYGEYLIAKAVYALEQKQQAAPQQQNQQPQNTQPSPEFIQAVQRLEQSEIELKKVAPDYDDVVDEYTDVIDSASPELKQLFLSVDNPSLAFYNLAKNGKLETLVDMPLGMAAIEIGKALSLGTPKLNKTSNAPTPIKGNTGTSAGVRNVTDMSYDQLRKELGL